MNYYIITFGCQMNKSDSERIASFLEKKGYKLASNPFAKAQEADLIVVNMCSVRQSAVDRVYGLIPKFEKLKNKNPKLKTILTGCILRKDRENFIKNFDHILKLPDLLQYHPKYKSNFSAFVPISTGCNNSCAYCVVPFTRGPLVCRKHEDILKQVKGIIENGFKEIWLLGQNVNDYHSPIEESIDFPKLLKMIDNISGNFWLRFTSPHPKNFSDDLIETMTKSKKVTPYLNLPLQSGDNEILKKMNRPYTTSQYKNLVKKIREKIPEICLSTDVIVGFPGETKEQFQNTAKLFKQIKFDVAYIAKYSPRPQTTAFSLEDNVPQEDKERRYKILSQILKETALENNKKYIGKTVEVLINSIKNNFLIGKTKTYKTVKLECQKDLVGQFVKMKVTDAAPFGLKAKII
jgi:tRNA-2-methylthio-N6-dimethylallyladenosine synthase